MTGVQTCALPIFQERLAGGLRGLTGLEREELRKRGWALGWWMMRGAFYENITKYVIPIINCLPLVLTNIRAWINSLTGKLRNKPLLDIVGGVIEDYEFLWDQYYFPTATL